MIKIIFNSKYLSILLAFSLAAAGTGLKCLHGRREERQEGKGQRGQQSAEDRKGTFSWTGLGEPGRLRSLRLGTYKKRLCCDLDAEVISQLEVAGSEDLTVIS